jgi:hypothetical protein
MKKIFELKPILVAAAIGAVMVSVISMFDADPADADLVGFNLTSILIGASIGAAVQIGVRITGAS